MLRIVKLTNGDIVIGDISQDNENDVNVEFPYTVKDLGQGPMVMPYELDLLMEPMETLQLRMFDIMWSKQLSSFPAVETQYKSAITGIETESQLLV